MIRLSLPTNAPLDLKYSVKYSVGERLKLQIELVEDICRTALRHLVVYSLDFFFYLPECTATDWDGLCKHFQL